MADYPYSVRTRLSQTLVKGHDNIENAKQDAAYRNIRANELCLDVRYDATDTPCHRGKATD